MDFVVNGWIIVECDSREFHGDWAAQRRDHVRDLASAALGFATLRVTAEDIMWRPDEVRRALTGLLRSPGGRRGPLLKMRAAGFWCQRPGARHNSDRTPVCSARLRGSRVPASGS